jgi:RNA polymerase sigma-70 factor (ECF subfamily)
MEGTMAEKGGSDPQVRQAREGSREAFDALARSFEDRLRNFIRSSIKPGYRDRLDVEEVLQETFVRSFRSIGSFQGDDREDLRRWMSGVARKTILRAEEDARRHAIFQLPDLPAGDPSPSKVLGREERFDRLQGALAALKEDHRRVIFLTRIEGLSLKEAADRMGRSPEAVRKLFWRALLDLRRALPETGSVGLPDRGLEWDQRDEE